MCLCMCDDDETNCGAQWNFLPVLLSQIKQELLAENGGGGVNGGI